MEDELKLQQRIANAVKIATQDLEERLNQFEQKRVRQQDIMPGAINSRQLGQVVLPVDTSTASASFGTGDQLLLTHTLSQNQGAKMLASVHTGIYIGSVDTANLLPGGSAIDESQFQLYTWLDWEETDGDNVVLRTYVRNISAGTVTIIFKLSDRYISNFPSASSG